MRDFMECPLWRDFVIRDSLGIRPDKIFCQSQRGVGFRGCPFQGGSTVYLKCQIATRNILRPIFVPEAQASDFFTCRSLLCYLFIFQAALTGWFDGINYNYFENNILQKQPTGVLCKYKCSWQVLRPGTLLKRDSNIGVFLLNLQNF